MRPLPDVQVLTDLGAYGINIPAGHQLEVQVLVKPRSFGLICTLMVFDFGACVSHALVLLVN